MFIPTKHLLRKQEVLQQYQEDLESWVQQASIEHIRQQYAWLHASEGPDSARYESLHPEDEHHPLCGQWDIEGTYLRSCNECHEFSLATWAVAMSQRPELKDLYPRMDGRGNAHD